MDIFGFQTDIAWEDPSENFSRIEAMLQGCPDAELAEALLVFPELATTGFSMASEALSPNGEAEAISFFGGIARSRRAWVVAGVPAIDPASGQAANEALCFGPGGELAARYRKQHPFSPANEGQHYLRGVKPTVFDLGPWRVAPLICYDLRFPEPFRAAAALGADCFLVVANWPRVRVAHWVALLQARAIENQAYVVGVNRCGSDPFLAYPGTSLAVDPQGEILARLEGEPGVLRASLDHELVRQWREDFPALRDAGLAAALAPPR